MPQTGRNHHRPKEPYLPNIFRAVMSIAMMFEGMPSLIVIQDENCEWWRQSFGYGRPGRFPWSPINERHDHGKPTDEYPERVMASEGFPTVAVASCTHIAGGDLTGLYGITLGITAKIATFGMSGDDFDSTLNSGPSVPRLAPAVARVHAMLRGPRPLLAMRDERGEWWCRHLGNNFNMASEWVRTRPLKTRDDRTRFAYIAMAEEGFRMVVFLECEAREDRYHLDLSIRARCETFDSFLAG